MHVPLEEGKMLKPKEKRKTNQEIKFSKQLPKDLID